MTYTIETPLFHDDLSWEEIRDYLTDERDLEFTFSDTFIFDPISLPEIIDPLHFFLWIKDKSQIYKGYFTRQDEFHDGTRSIDYRLNFYIRMGTID